MRDVLLQLGRQAPAIRLVSLAVLLPIIVLYAVVGLQTVVPFSLLLRDANTGITDPRFEVTFFHGALSSLGVLLWWSTASVCAFAAFMLRGGAPGLERTFLVYLAVFTGLLALDDLFMLHEEVLPVLLGVPEVALYAIYGVMAAGLVGFVRIILEADFAFLGMAFGFFSLSLTADQNVFIVLFDVPAGVSLLLEDLAKMLGIVCWLVFSLRVAAQILSARL